MGRKEHKEPGRMEWRHGNRLEERSKNMADKIGFLRSNEELQ